MEKMSKARTRALEAAERLFRSQGYAATGLTEILELSGAPKGSFYFYFAGGKRQLASEALRRYGAEVSARLRGLADLRDGDPAGFARALCASIAAEMGASGWSLGCLAQNLGNELAPADAELADALAEIFADWIGVIARAIETARDGPGSARARATALLAAIEGARTLARASRSGAAFEAVGEVFAAELTRKTPGRT